MITSQECIETIVEKNFKGFKIFWDQHLEFWGDENAVFSHFTIDCIGKNEENILSDIFSLIEEFIENGNEEVKEAITMCFLENISNQEKDISKVNYEELLGKNAKELLVELNHFWKGEL